MNRSYRNLPLNPLRAFAIASRHRTFTAAASQLGVSQVAVSRQISTLESYLGVKLFERGSRSARLTEVGRAFGHEIAELLDDIETATQQLMSHETEKTVNVRLYPTLAHHWLLPRLGEFTDIYPHYKIRLDTVVEPLDFRSTQLDVALQLGYGTWRDTKSRKLFDEVVDVVCSPRYAALHDNFASIESLNEAELLHAHYRRREWEIWAREAEVKINHREGMAFDTSLLVYRAAKQDLGLAIGQIDLLQSEIEQGHLIQPVNKPVRTGAAFYVSWPTTKSVAVKTRAFINWILAQAGQPPEFTKTKSGPSA
ncbi:LysR substrate-binding domain-containing protein [Pelagibacterium lacus]|uniref:LysR family transcriptional regulator n=1 Tax=Pelagibacterium lacus TaxID=2282655 RepID=A0A369W4E2_9HYPH|nr:LysR substrate-binding domain-containing protein [Pelagibacterium lacus]RDE09564.1 LysR family transcriptional regulator [Pelagibacterium lacus]